MMRHIAPRVSMAAGEGANEGGEDKIACVGYAAEEIGHAHNQQWQVQTCKGDAQQAA
jgi:hypothetical protein